MPDVRLPLSGNVTQTINPWTWMFAPVGSQVGLINVDVGSSADPEMEQAMLKDVGSYGRQLGRIGDVLLVLLKHVRLEDLTGAEQAAISALRDQLKSVDETKTRLTKRRGKPETAAPTVDVPSAPEVITNNAAGHVAGSNNKRTKTRPRR
jgi:hypothetical protein